MGIDKDFAELTDCCHACGNTRQDYWLCDDCVTRLNRLSAENAKLRKALREVKRQTNYASVANMVAREALEKSEG